MRGSVARVTRSRTDNSESHFGRGNHGSSSSCDLIVFDGDRLVRADLSLPWRLHSGLRGRRVTHRQVDCKAVDAPAAAAGVAPLGLGRAVVLRSLSLEFPCLLCIDEAGLAEGSISTSPDCWDVRGCQPFVLPY